MKPIEKEAYELFKTVHGRSMSSEEHIKYFKGWLQLAKKVRRMVKQAEAKGWNERGDEL